jgi:hypothetical protein
MNAFLRCLGLLSLLALGTLTQVGAGGDPPDPKKKAEAPKEVSGAAEFLRSVPKHFATLKAVDPARGQVTLLIEGEVLPKIWPLTPDAEIKVLGWWGRLGDFTLEDRVWVWFKMDRNKQAVAVTMLADEVSEQVIHDRQVSMEAGPDQVKTGYAQTTGKKIRLQFTAKELSDAQKKQKEKLRQLWIKEGLPGSVTFVHVFSGEMDLMLDHEAMRWGRSLQPGDQVTLAAQPPIKAVVKTAQAWRERTQVRLVVRSLDLADLNPGQRLHLIRTPPTDDIHQSALPFGLDQPRGKQERIGWFLANIYCTCGVKGDTCTGHFYTLASCNPNTCGMPKSMRRQLEKMMDAEKTDRQIMEELLQKHGPLLLRPHLLP